MAIGLVMVRIPAMHVASRRAPRVIKVLPDALSSA